MCIRDRLMEDSILKDVILVLKDEGGELRKSYTTYDVRKLLNGKEKKKLAEIAPVEHATV